MTWFDVLPMSQISHRLFVGGRAAAANLAKENPARITAVLCVHQVMDYPQDPNIVYMHQPFNDGEAIPPTAFVKCLGWLKFMYENGHTILVHCAAGISRSVTILTSFMHYEGIAEFSAALDQIRMRRPVASPAPAVLNSAKQMLHVYPYDGSYEYTAEHEKTIHDVVEAVQSQRAAFAHPDEKCPMRQFLLSRQESNTPRHAIPCTCEKLLNPLEIAQGKEKIIIEVTAKCIQCGKDPIACECVDGYI
jgi:protein-tyrosine phosphatase